jgi:hypothetical protein
MVQPGRIAGESRAWPRIVPARSLSAAILGGDLKVAHGTVSNISESGAFLVTDHPLARGAAVRLVLSEGPHGFLDTEARIVWSADGVDPNSEIVGALQGVLFADLSPVHRERLRRRLLLAGILNPGFLENYPPEEEDLADILIDPDIEQLISDETIDYDDGVDEIRRALGPYLDRYVSKIYDERSWRDDTTRAILDYLKHQIPGYPFDRRLDCEFITELMADFPGLDILEEVKTFRWHHDRGPASRVTSPRAALRRWIASSMDVLGLGGNA